MCRLLGYIGPPIQLDSLLSEPSHSLIVQSYQPREMQTAILNADGFGIGWYHPQRQTAPFTYRQTVPIWNDTNLPHLSRYIESSRILAYVRSATPGLAVDLSNCQPFQHEQLLFIHNGFIENFRQTVYRPIRDRLSDTAYHAIHGLTDSEHLFGLFVDAISTQPNLSLAAALRQTLTTAAQLAQKYEVRAALNLMVSDGDQIVASRFDTSGSDPSLYYLRDDPQFPNAVLIASEPLSEGQWTPCPKSSILSVGADLNVIYDDLSDLQLQPSTLS